MNGFRRGVRLGIDVGRARVGVSRSDVEGLLALPVETVPRSPQTLDRLAELAGEYEPLEFIVGLPVNMRGAETASTTDARTFAGELLLRTGVPVRLVDERLSTVSAHSSLRSAGRNQRNSRSIVDQVAAVVLLQHAIDIEKNTGSPAGVAVSLTEESF